MTTDPTILAAAERCAACGAPVSRGSSVPRDATQCVVCEVAHALRSWRYVAPGAAQARVRARRLRERRKLQRWACAMQPRGGDRHAKHA